MLNFRAKFCQVQLFYSSLLDSWHWRLFICSERFVGDQRLTENLTLFWLNLFFRIWLCFCWICFYQNLTLFLKICVKIEKKRQKVFVFDTYLNTVRLLDGEHFAVFLSCSDCHHDLCSVSLKNESRKEEVIICPHWSKINSNSRPRDCNKNWIDCMYISMYTQIIYQSKWFDQVRLPRCCWLFWFEICEIVLGCFS